MTERRRNATREQQYESAAYKTWVDRVAANVRRLREARGWTQEEAADVCDLSRRHYQSVEAGTLNLTVTTLARLTTGFDVDPIELVTAAPAPRKRQPGRPRRQR